MAILVTTVLLTADLFGLIPDADKDKIRLRQSICESLLAQSCMAIQEQDYNQVRRLLQETVSQEQDVLSVAIRLTSDKIVASSGPHDKLWASDHEDDGAGRQCSVPILVNEETWGNLEVCFKPIRQTGIKGFFLNRESRLFSYVGCVSFVLFFIFLRKTLKHLDPSAVIPARVKSAMDSFAECVFMVDANEHIVLANSALTRTLGVDLKRLLGQKASKLPWVFAENQESSFELPWLATLDESQSYTNVTLRLKCESGTVHTFKTNCAPLGTVAGKCKGALVTLDDITTLQKKNSRLRKLLRMLRNSTDQVKQQNKQLTFLATRDALTGCLNRRSFFEKLEEEWGASERTGLSLGCIMVDVDHFKSVNDTHGHSMGDRVLKSVAEVLQNNTRKNEMVCRYGGEEFCVLLFGATIADTIQAAERFRGSIEKQDHHGLSITASLGTSSSELGASNCPELLDQADKALYHAKRTGRNRVVGFDTLLEEMPQNSN